MDEDAAARLLRTVREAAESGVQVEVRKYGTANGIQPPMYADARR